MQNYLPLNPRYEEWVRTSFARQNFMATIGATLVAVTPGEVTIELPFRDDLTQQHGFIHAGIVTTIVDNACGYAALSLMPEEAGVLTAEYKVNFLAPAQGTKLIARGWVIKPGRTLTVCSGEVSAVQNGQEKPIAAMLATMMTIQDNGAVQG